MFLEIKENKSYIFTPWECVASMGLFMTIESMLCKDSIVGFLFLMEGCILSVHANHIAGRSTILTAQQYPASEPHFYNIFSVVFFAFQPERIIY